MHAHLPVEVRVDADEAWARAREWRWKIDYQFGTSREYMGHALAMLNYYAVIADHMTEAQARVAERIVEQLPYMLHWGIDRLDDAPVRYDPLDPQELIDRCIEGLEQGLNVQEACDLAGIPRSTFYKKKGNDKVLTKRIDKAQKEGAKKASDRGDRSRWAPASRGRR